MQDIKESYVAFLLFVVVFLNSCASIHTPQNWLVNSDNIQTDIYGGWINIETKTKQKFYGELIAISEDSIFVANDTLIILSQLDVKSARLVTYKSDAETMGLLAALGVLSTLSNGAFFVFTGPLWIIGGSIAASNRSFEPVIDYPENKFTRFIPFARYPQGFPEVLNRSRIKMKFYR